MLKYSVRGKLPSVDINFTPQLNHIAKRIIIPEIHSRMYNEESIDGVKYPPLEESTLRKKRKNGQSEKILEATGQLKKQIYSGTITRNKVMISIKPDRKMIGKYLQVDGVKSKKYGKRYFNFFGINTVAEKRGIEYIREYIKRAIKNATAK